MPWNDGRKVGPGRHLRRRPLPQGVAGGVGYNRETPAGQWFSRRGFYAGMRSGYFFTTRWQSVPRRSI